MSENKLFEAVAKLVLRSISIWEDMHLYALTYSPEYNAFWEMLDEKLKASVCSCRKRNRLERLVPFTMSYTEYYKSLLSQENYDKIRDQYWKKQLKIILADNKFRAVMDYLNLILVGQNKSKYRYLEQYTIAKNSDLQFHTRVG